jgi:diguanylate cyclase (GGDEF)-like protein
MQLKRYKLLLKNLRQEANFTNAIAAFRIYRKSNGAWYEENESVIHDNVLLNPLERTLARTSPWRNRNSKESFFPLSSFQTVIVTESASPTRKSTRQKIQRTLAEISKRSTTEFNAVYDGLTGLLNSLSSEEKIREMLLVPSGASDIASAEIKPSKSTVLFALDLDNFKQVNDSYGHEYGDLVLKCFANRLESVVNVVQKEFGSALTLEVGRSGGEEFLVVVSGDMTVQRAKEIAERIKITVSGQELPTEAEWKLITGGHKSEIIPLPHVSERKITTSIGLSSLKPLVVNEKVNATITELRRESDAALYKAKAGGRNTIRYFPEIRDKYGTVLEHHAETNIITIDIGSQVNVRVGQEFHVYHPDFTGEKPFISSDGRSKKRLGVYPRVPSGRLVVMEVQQEISFCTIADKTIERFPVGSILEQIPLGSIYHLVSAEAKASVISPSEVAELESHISQTIDRGERPLAALFSLQNVQAVEKAHGTAFVNRALAALYEEIRRVFDVQAKICQIESDKIAVAATIESKAKYQELIKKVLEGASKKVSNLAKFVVGVFTTKVQFDEIPGDKSVLQPKKALQYARYAAVPLAGDERQIRFFTPALASSILLNQRSEKAHAEALVDYKTLHDLGVEFSNFENQAALAAYELGKYDIAMNHVQRAIVLEPDAPIFKANLAYIQFKSDQLLQAYETFSDLHGEHPETKLPDIYIPPEALATYAAFKNDATSVDPESAKTLLEKALTLIPEGKTETISKIRTALAEISSSHLVAEKNDDSSGQHNELALNEIWTNVVEAIGKVSPFVRTYLLEAVPISFESEIFRIGFSEEFEDHLGLVDNERNKNLIKIKLEELGYRVSEIKFETV